MNETTEGPRYEALAQLLMDAPDPVRAIASLIGDHEARLDALAERLHSVECRQRNEKGLAKR